MSRQQRPGAPFTWIPSCISYYVHYRLWDEIINPFLNCNGCTVENWEWISNLILLVMLGLQLKLFVKLEELHIVTTRKPLIHQNQPVAQYLHKIQPCMLYFMPVDLHHSARSWKLSTGNEVIGKFNIPADDTNAFGNLEMHLVLS